MLWRIIIEKVKAQFKKFFGIPLPPQMLYDGRLIPLDYDLKPVTVWRMPTASLLASEIALESPLPVIMSLMDSFYSAPEGYYFIGFYDRGINNFGFFYAQVDDWRRIYFRFNYGGAYLDDDEERKNIREFLPRYFEFEQKLEGRVKQLTVFEGVGDSNYEIVLPDDRIIEERFFPPLLSNPDFEDKFKHVLEVL